MSTKEIKDAVEEVSIAQKAVEVANQTFEDAKMAKQVAFDALASAQNKLGQLLDGAAMIGGDYTLKNKAN